MKKHLALAAGIGLALAQLPATSSAAIINVACTGTGGGPNGLATAITTANSTSATQDTIRLAPGCVYSLDTQNDTGATSGGPIGAALLPRVTSKITIQGRGASLVRDEAIPGIRIANVDETGHLILNRVKLRNGEGGSGGAIYNNSGKLTITNSTLSGNKTFGAGGAVYSLDDLVVRGSTFSGNSAGSPTLLMSNFGGAISNYGNAAITNSTFFDNEAVYSIYGSYGGAIANYGTMTINHSTIAENTAGFGGGGLYNGTGTITLKSSIIASNTLPNCTGTITGTPNVVFDDNPADDTCPGVEADPRLGNLSNNGGPTKTMALRAGSAAVARVPQAKCAARDQRGLRRPTSGKCDAGAFEKNPL